MSIRTNKMVLCAAIVAAAASIGLSASISKAAVLAAWNFENDSVAVNNNPATSSGTGTASSIGMNVYSTPNVGVTTDDVVLGKNSDTGTNTVANTTNTWRVRGQAGSNGAANGWSSLAPVENQGAVFATSTSGSGASAINVSFDWYATTQGEANLVLAYTLDDTAANPVWVDVPVTLSGSDTGLVVKNNASGSGDTNTVTGSYLSDNILNSGVAATAGQDWFTGLTGTITDPAALNDANFAVGLLNASTGADDVATAGTALNNNSGNWRFDNIAITTAVPEPASFGLLSLSGMALLARRRNRSAK